MLMLLLVGMSSARAQSDTLIDLFDMDLAQLMRVEVVSSSKKQESQALAPNVITVHPRGQIEGFGWQSMNQMLYLQAGFFPSQDYDRRTVGSRGLAEGWNNNHLLLLVDGVPFNDNLYGTAYTWDITPLTFAKNLEVIRGPGAALYGSNATNGVLTLNTISHSDLAGKNGYVQSMLGNAGTMRHSILTAMSSPKLEAVIGFSHFRTTGQEHLSFDGSGQLDGGLPIERQVNDKRMNNYVFFKLLGKEKLKGLSLQYHHQSWAFQTGHGWLWHIPEHDESMAESRELLVAKYERSNARLSQEYVLAYQRHDIDWNLLFYNRGANDNLYPDGAREYLRTDADNLFIRVQERFALPSEASLVAALETSIFLYNGDREHYSNIDLNDELGLGNAPWPEGGERRMGPWLEAVNELPVNNMALFTSFNSGQMLGQRLRLVAGLRFDNAFFDYRDLSQADKPIRSKSFQQFSPRVALLLEASASTMIKVMLGNAFRAPSPTEMFGSNTWTLASNIEQLKAESLTTWEAALIQQLFQHKMEFRANAFLTSSRNQIAYSIANGNLSTNIFSSRNAGLESEIWLNLSELHIFANVSYTRRIDEEIFADEQTFVSEHPDRVTWAPAFTANLGALAHLGKWQASLTGHYQGRVERRDLDLGPMSADWRPSSIAPWLSVDARLARGFGNLELFAQATNLADGKNPLVKTLDYPFDYRSEGRRVQLGLTYRF